MMIISTLSRRAKAGEMFTAPDVVVESTELILVEEADVETSSSPFPGLYEVEREPGTNKVGMVAWRLLLLEGEVGVREGDERER